MISTIFFMTFLVTTQAGPTPGNIFDAVNDEVHKDVNAVNGIINGIKDQVKQTDLNLDCIGDESPEDCIKDNAKNLERKMENFFTEIYGKACVTDNQCSRMGSAMVSYCNNLGPHATFQCTPWTYSTVSMSLIGLILVSLLACCLCYCCCCCC